MDFLEQKNDTSCPYAKAREGCDEAAAAGSDWSAAGGKSGGTRWFGIRFSSPAAASPRLSFWGSGDNMKGAWQQRFSHMDEI